MLCSQILNFLVGSTSLGLVDLILRYFATSTEADSENVVAVYTVQYIKNFSVALSRLRSQSYYTLFPTPVKLEAHESLNVHARLSLLNVCFLGHNGHNSRYIIFLASTKSQIESFICGSGIRGIPSRRLRKGECGLTKCGCLIKSCFILGLT